MSYVLFAPFNPIGEHFSLVLSTIFGNFCIKSWVLIGEETQITTYIQNTIDPTGVYVNKMYIRYAEGRHEESMGNELVLKLLLK